MPRTTVVQRIAGTIAVGAVAVLAVSCGSSGSSSSSTTAAPSTTVPSVSSVISTCQKAAQAAASIGTMLDNASASTTMSQIDNEVKMVVGPVQACQSAFQAAIPGLPSGTRAAATAYVASLGPIIQSLSNPPTTAAAVGSWVQQFTAQSASLSQAKAAVVKADPAFANF